MNNTIKTFAWLSSIGVLGSVGSDIAYVLEFNTCRTTTHMECIFSGLQFVLAQLFIFWPLLAASILGLIISAIIYKKRKRPITKMHKIVLVCSMVAVVVAGISKSIVAS